MFSILKKSYRLLRIILHVLWGAVQVIYYLDENKSHGDKEKRIIQHWFGKFVQLQQIEKNFTAKYILKTG